MTWRRGTKGKLQVWFAVVRVRVVDGAELAFGPHLPGEEVWLVGEVKVFKDLASFHAAAATCARACMSATMRREPQ